MWKWQLRTKETSIFEVFCSEGQDEFHLCFVVGCVWTFKSHFFSTFLCTARQKRSLSKIKAASLDRFDCLRETFYSLWCQQNRRRPWAKPPPGPLTLLFRGSEHPPNWIWSPANHVWGGGGVASDPSKSQGNCWHRTFSVFCCQVSCNELRDQTFVGRLVYLRWSDQADTFLRHRNFCALALVLLFWFIVKIDLNFPFMAQIRIVFVWEWAARLSLSTADVCHHKIGTWSHDVEYKQATANIFHCRCHLMQGPKKKRKRKIWVSSKMPRLGVKYVYLSIVKNLVRGESNKIGLRLLWQYTSSPCSCKQDCTIVGASMDTWITSIL